MKRVHIGFTTWWNVDDIDAKPKVLEIWDDKNEL